MLVLVALAFTSGCKKLPDQVTVLRNSGKTLEERVTVGTSGGPSVMLSCSPGAVTAQNGAATSFAFSRGTTAGTSCSPLPTMSPLATATTCGLIDLTVAAGANYCYEVAGVNSAGTSAPDGPVYASVPAVAGPPNPPTGLAVVTITSKNVLLKWTAPAPQPGVAVVNYALYNCYDAACPSPPAPVAVSGTGYTAVCNHQNKTCYFMLRANDTVAGKAVQSAPSNIAKATV
jgi:hypothetical protein